MGGPAFPTPGTHSARSASTGFTRLARRFYHPREASAVEACDPATRRELFYDFWTLKEAGVKCEGGALGPALRTKTFALDYQAGAPGRIESFPPGSARHPLYCLLDIPGQYRLAICWRHPPGTVPGLRLFDWRGDEGITPVPLSLRATSALLATGANLA